MKERNNHDDGTRVGSKSRRPDISEPLKDKDGSKQAIGVQYPVVCNLLQR
ncbi:MAG TPA: hypothetical protein VFZ67_01905 [Nitrososphaera sp.]